MIQDQLPHECGERETAKKLAMKSHGGKVSIQ